MKRLGQKSKKFWKARKTMINTILTWIAITLLVEMTIAFPIVIGIAIKVIIQELRG